MIIRRPAGVASVPSPELDVRDATPAQPVRGLADAQPSESAVTVPINMALQAAGVSPHAARERLARAFAEARPIVDLPAELDTALAGALRAAAIGVDDDVAAGADALLAAARCLAPTVKDALLDMLSMRREAIASELPDASAKTRFLTRAGGLVAKLAGSI